MTITFNALFELLDTRPFEAKILRRRALASTPIPKPANG
jgi:hypothetical protein